MIIIIKIINGVDNKLLIEEHMKLNKSKKDKNTLIISSNEQIELNNIYDNENENKDEEKEIDQIKKEEIIPKKANIKNKEEDKKEDQSNKNEQIQIQKNKTTNELNDSPTADDNNTIGDELLVKLLIASFSNSSS